MRLTFTRTGGLFAAPGLRVEALIALQPLEGTVTAEGGYTRTFGEQETGDLNRLVGAAIAEARTVGSAPATGSPDAYVFRFSVDDQGRSAVFMASQDGQASGAVAQLVGWASLECDAIARWKSRA